MCSRPRATSAAPLARRSLSRAQSGVTPLWQAAYHGETECVRRLVAAGANKDIAAKDFKKPIDVVCLGGDQANKAEIEALLRAW